MQTFDQYLAQCPLTSLYFLFADLPALFNHPQGPNPRDFSEQATSHAMPSSNPPLYHQTQSSSNLPSASALSHRLGGMF